MFLSPPSLLGEHPAAMQHNSSKMHCSNFYFSICCMLFTILTCCLQHLMCTTNAATATTTINRTLMFAPSTAGTVAGNGTRAGRRAAATEKQHKKQKPAVTKVIQSKQILSTTREVGEAAGSDRRTSTIPAVVYVVVAPLTINTTSTTSFNTTSTETSATLTTATSQPRLMLSCSSRILR